MKEMATMDALISLSSNLVSDVNLATLLYCNVIINEHQLQYYNIVIHADCYLHKIYYPCSCSRSSAASYVNYFELCVCVCVCVWECVCEWVSAQQGFFPHWLTNLMTYTLLHVRTSCFTHVIIQKETRFVLNVDKGTALLETFRPTTFMKSLMSLVIVPSAPDVHLLELNKGILQESTKLVNLWTKFTNTENFVHWLYNLYKQVYWCCKFGSYMRS